jgi:1-deoxy-D-xylulose-5-phosphate reductoisomerase
MEVKIRLKTLTILGSTGSIGKQTLEVVKAFPEKLRVYALVACKSVDLMEDQVRAFRPSFVVMMEEKAAIELRERLRDLPVIIEHGMEGILQAVTFSDVDTVVSALSGRIGLEPTLAAIKAGKTIALANKETLVAAGELVLEAAREMACPILPIDSEHSAIFQCLEDNPQTVEKIILTASGGPFLGWSREKLAAVTPKEALQHPNWDMGWKITIDSASMMNKGLEVIEAHHLFGLSYDNIEVLVHPESIVHSMVAYKDGSVLAQLGKPDMRMPIQYALSCPTRWENSFQRLDLRGKTLSFLEPDLVKFPALALAYKVGRKGGTLPAVMNAANEVAVLAFLQNRLAYHRLTELVGEVCDRHNVLLHPDLGTILEADAWARGQAEDLLRCTKFNA